VSGGSLIAAGQVFTGGGFLAFGLWNIRNRAALATLISARRLPFANAVATAGIGVQICGGALLLIGLWMQIAALILFAFVIGATLLAHLPLGRKPEERQENVIACLMNLIVAGGLLAFAGISA
jgi:putative oxidoreductase